jgi:DNA-binding NtrC family response regulator
MPGVQTAFVQVHTSEIRALVRATLPALRLEAVDAIEDPSRVAVAIIELSADRPVARALPGWLVQSHLPRVALVLDSTEALAIEALRHGFREYLRPALTVEDLRTALERLLRRAERADDDDADDRIIGRSAVMRAVRDQVRRVASSRTPVLITGETGTGKELIAESVHEWSPRRGRPFVAVNCGAIPEGLVESELFGHERGAFTGATSSRPGRFRQSNGGTIFLDEVSELDWSAQVKLLRVLETRAVHALGSERAVPLDLRVVAACNQDLAARVREKAFREDLFYRLNVVRVEVPPLRARSEDVPLLVAHFCRRFCEEFNRRWAGYAAGDLSLLQQYDWPGNVRELRNVVEASFVHSSTRPEAPLELPPSLMAVLQKRDALDERQRVVEALFATDWNVSRAAQRLKVSRMTLYRRLGRHEIRRPLDAIA